MLAGYVVVVVVARKLSANWPLRQFPLSQLSLAQRLPQRTSCYLRGGESSIIIIIIAAAAASYINYCFLTLI